jgi:hypothetical protein
METLAEWLAQVNVIKKETIAGGSIYVEFVKPGDENWEWAASNWPRGCCCISCDERPRLPAGIVFICAAEAPSQCFLIPVCHRCASDEVKWRAGCRPILDLVIAA